MKEFSFDLGLSHIYELDGYVIIESSELSRVFRNGNSLIEIGFALFNAKPISAVRYVSDEEDIYGKVRMKFSGRLPENFIEIIDSFDNLN